MVKNATSAGKARDLIGLAAFLALCLLVSALGGMITATSVESWYPSLVKPFFNPPDWLFAPVWTVLYILMAVAGWRVWRSDASRTGRRIGLTVFALQLGLNLLWSALFFGARRPDWAMIEILVLLVVIIVNTALFHRIDRAAGALFVPYVLWVGYAAALNAAIWWLN